MRIPLSGADPHLNGVTPSDADAALGVGKVLKPWNALGSDRLLSSAPLWAQEAADVKEERKEGITRDGGMKLSFEG